MDVFNRRHEFVSFPCRQLVVDSLSTHALVAYIPWLPWYELFFCLLFGGEGSGAVVGSQLLGCCAAHAFSNGKACPTGALS